jgi:hypothetical protein
MRISGQGEERLNLASLERLFPEAGFPTNSPEIGKLVVARHSQFTLSGLKGK